MYFRITKFTKTNVTKNRLAIRAHIDLRRRCTNTVVLKRKSKWHNLWSKWPISDLMFYNIKMPPSSCPLGFSLLLTGALIWGTVQTSTSTSTGIMQGQT